MAEAFGIACHGLVNATRWYRRASRHTTAFYGQLASARHCQSNGRELQNALYKDVQAINSRHSAKAEARFCLKMSRRLR